MTQLLVWFQFKILHAYKILSNLFIYFITFRYNKLRRESRLVEFELVQDKIENIEALIKEGEHNLTWLSESKNNFNKSLV